MFLLLPEINHIVLQLRGHLRDTRKHEAHLIYHCNWNLLGGTEKKMKIEKHGRKRMGKEQPKHKIALKLTLE